MPDYKKMAAVDEHGRSAYALEHKFRNWRHAGRKILEAYPEEAGDPEKTKKPRTPKKANGVGIKGKGSQTGENGDGEDLEDIFNGKVSLTGNYRGERRIDSQNRMA